MRLRVFAKRRRRTEVVFPKQHTVDDALQVFLPATANDVIVRLSKRIAILRFAERERDTQKQEWCILIQKIELVSISLFFQYWILLHEGKDPVGIGKIHHREVVLNWYRTSESGVPMVSSKAR